MSMIKMFSLGSNEQASFDEQYLFFIDERYFCSLFSMKDQKNIFRILPEYDLLNSKYLAVAMAKLLQQRGSLSLMFRDEIVIDFYIADDGNVKSVLAEKEY